MDRLYGMNLIASASFWILLAVAAAATAAWMRRVWVGGAVAAALVLLVLPPWRLLRAPLLLVIFVLVGLAAGVCGWALRLRRRPRTAALGGLWAGAILALVHLYILSEQPHSSSDLVFAGALLATLLVLGPLTVIALPPDDRAQQRPPAA